MSDKGSENAARMSRLGTMPTTKCNKLRTDVEQAIVEEDIETLRSKLIEAANDCIIPDVSDMIVELGNKGSWDQAMETVQENWEWEGEMKKSTPTEQEVRDDICGSVVRAVMASAGETCGRRRVSTVADQLDAIRGVTVDRWKDADDQADNRDFVDLTITRSASAGQMFLVLTRNGFIPEAMAGNWEGGTPEGEEGRVVLQWKR